MSIRTTLFAVVISLGALVAAYSAYFVYTSYHDKTHAQGAISVYHTVNGMIDTADALEAEKGTVLLALVQNDPVSATRSAHITKIRELVDKTFQNEMDYISSRHSFPGKTEALQKTQQTAEALAQIRQKVDNALVLPKTARATNLVQEWKKAVESHIESSVELAHIIEENVFTPDAVHNLLETKSYTWLITETLGKQNETVSTLIAKNQAFSLEEYGDIKGMTARMAAVWELLDGLMEGAYVTTALRDSYKKVKAEYNDTYLPALDQVIQAAVERTAYPVSSDEWFTQTNTLIEQLAAFSDVAGDVTADVANANESTASSFMLIALMLLGGVIAMGGFALFIVNNRVIHPVQALRENINRIKDGDTNFEIVTTRNDEIATISRAVEDLRGTVAKAFEQQQMIENVPIGVIVANPHDDFKVFYTNQANDEGLKHIEDKGGIEILNATKKSLTSLFNDPGKLASFKDVKNLPKSGRIKLGTEWINIKSSAVCNNEGEYTALMCTWQNVTDQVNLADNFENSVKGVVDLVSSSSNQLKASASMMAENADKTNHSANIVASASEEASTNVQTVASSAEELSESIQEIARQVAQSTMICGKAVGEAKSTNETIQSLADAATKIGEVVNLITEIAGKTNLLALNATIEAARAGDAGKGFAVVASEVKDLASQTAKATDEIAGQISAIQNSTTNAVTAIETISNVIGDLNEIATSIASAVEEQGAATREIASNVQQTATGTQEVSSNIIDVSKAASETGGTANEVLSSSEELACQSDKLRDEVDRFLEKIRAA